MKITKINIQNYAGAVNVKAEFTTPMQLFAGANFSGKSSTKEAICAALGADPVRVLLKKDYAQLVTDGAKAGLCEVETPDFKASFALPSGKAAGFTPTKAMPYVLDAQLFTSLDVAARRSFLFGLMGLKSDAATICAKLVERGCNVAKIEASKPLLSAGFDSAHKEATAKARDAKSAWRTHTGEAYGSEKAQAWKADKPEFDASALVELPAKITAISHQLSAANQKWGEMTAHRKNAAGAVAQLATLRETASKYARITDKLLRDEADAAKWAASVAELEPLAKGVIANTLNCPDCGAFVELRGAALHKHEPQKAPDANAVAELPKHQAALKLALSAVANGKRDQQSADAAAKAIEELEKNIRPAPDELEFDELRSTLADLAKADATATAALNTEEGKKRQAAHAETRTSAAAAAHKDVCEWLQIAEALAPGGIPGDMLKEALAPINARLLKSATDAEWPLVVIGDDMDVIAGKPYAMLSESEKWRTNAMIAEAVAFISGLKFLVLDGFDVLDGGGRVDLIAWLDILAQDGEVEAALIFGTLKALPAGLPATMTAHWIKSGRLV